MNPLIIFKLEASLQLNPVNFYALYLMFLSCQYGQCFFITNKSIQATEIRTFSLEFYEPKLFDLSLRLLDHPTVSGRYEHVRGECNHQLACLFGLYLNHPAALRFAKRAYEHCLRSSDHAQLAIRKAVYLESLDAFAKLPPLRFALGDEVEFLHELETGSELKLGKIAELYYRERDFGITFNAPDRLQLLADSDSRDQPPVYAWVNAARWASGRLRTLTIRPGWMLRLRSWLRCTAPRSSYRISIAHWPRTASSLRCCSQSGVSSYHSILLASIAFLCCIESP